MLGGMCRWTHKTIGAGDDFHDDVTYILYVPNENDTDG